MSLVTLDNLTIGFRGPSLLDGVNAVIERNQRIGLLGNNGAGKSTLMKIISGDLKPDTGSYSLAVGAHVERLVQEVPEDLKGSISEVLKTGWRSDQDHPDTDDSWEMDKLLDRILREMNLEGEREVSQLSAGMKRRVLLGKALMAEPDLLLLDEPTNHLDLEAIEWLEKFLCHWPTTLMFVTHDRRFLQNVATRIMEIDRGNLFDWSCNYTEFLKRKQQSLEAEEKQNALFDKKLAEEERWIRQGIKARRTRNEGRVRALKAMRVERSNRRERQGTANLRIQESERSGQLVAEAKEVSYSYGEKPIFTNLTTTVMRGDKLGLIGPNGAGKTTLLRVLLGELPPTAGNVRLGTNLQVVYFDQLRGQLDSKQTAEQSVADGYDTVKVGNTTQHVLGYLQDFLFTPERARTPIQYLSGGERNRLLLAKLFTKPANVLVLDEPTNDLDAETLEMLEERLIDYTGTLILVSHDRAFLNNVITSSLVFEPEGVREYVGGYDDWIRQRNARLTDNQEEESVHSKPKATGKTKQTSTKKLSYKDQRELESLPDKIEELEQKLSDLHIKMADPDFYQGPPGEIAAAQKETQQYQEELSHAYSRWEELEAS